VRVAPCTFRGRPTAPPFAATARVLDDAGEIAHAEEAIAANYGRQRRVYYRILAGQEHAGSYVEVTPVPSQ